MPVEVIEHIAEALCVPIYPSDEENYVYLGDFCTDFSGTRYDLSALSQVSSSVRSPVERVLYRTIQLDLLGWDGVSVPLKAQHFTGGSLRLLLNTLDKRPELGRLIRTVAIGWFDSSLTAGEVGLAEQGLQKFLRYSPRVAKLMIATMPPCQVVEHFSCSNLTSFATRLTSSKTREQLQAILRQFPCLKQLHVLGFSSPRDASIMHPHRLEWLGLDGPHQNIAATLLQALKLCSGTVKYLTLRMADKKTGNYNQPPLAPLTLPEGLALRSLHMDRMNILYHSKCVAAQILQSVPLHHLHLSGIVPLTPEGWAKLPRTLRSLTISGFYNKLNYTPSLIACFSSVTSRARTLKRVAVFEEEQESRMDIVMDTTLQEYCNSKDIPYEVLTESSEHYSHKSSQIVIDC